MSTKFTADFSRELFEFKVIHDSKHNFARRQRIQQSTKLMSAYSLHLLVCIQPNAVQLAINETKAKQQRQK